MDKLKNLQWNCRGLNNKINNLILFSAEKDIDIICVNEVKKWQKSTPLSYYIVAKETYANGHHGSVILIKNNIVIKRVEPVEKENEYRGKNLRNTETMHHAAVFWGLLDSICLQFAWKTTFTGKIILRNNVKCFCMW